MRSGACKGLAVTAVGLIATRDGFPQSRSSKAVPVSTESNTEIPQVGSAPSSFQLIRIRWFRQVKVIDVARTVDSLNVGDLQQELEHAMETEAPAEALLLINFRMIGYLQSGAWRRLVETMAAASARGRAVSVCHAPEVLETLLNTSEFRGTIRLWDDLKQAVQTWNDKRDAEIAARKAAPEEADSTAAATPSKPERKGLFGRKINGAAEAAGEPATPPSAPGPPIDTAGNVAVPSAGNVQTAPVPSGPSPSAPQSPGAAATPRPPAVDSKWSSMSRQLGDKLDAIKYFCIDKPAVAGAIGLGVVALVLVPAYFVFFRGGNSENVKQAVPRCEALYGEYTTLIEKGAEISAWGELSARAHTQLDPAVAELSALGGDRTPSQTESLAAIKSLFELVDPELDEEERRRAEQAFERHLQAAKSGT